MLLRLVSKLQLLLSHPLSFVTLSFISLNLWALGLYSLKIDLTINSAALASWEVPSNANTLF